MSNPFSLQRSSSSRMFGNEHDATNQGSSLALAGMPSFLSDSLDPEPSLPFRMDPGGSFTSHMDLEASFVSRMDVEGSFASGVVVEGSFASLMDFEGSFTSRMDLEASFAMNQEVCEQFMNERENLMAQFTSLPTLVNIEQTGLEFIDINEGKMSYFEIILLSNNGLTFLSL